MGNSLFEIFSFLIINYSVIMTGCLLSPAYMPRRGIILPKVLQTVSFVLQK